MRALSAHFLALSPVPTLRSLLKLYTSLDTRKLAGFLDAGVDEEEVLSWMMVMKNTGRCVGRVRPATGTEKDEEKGGTSTTNVNGASTSLLDGEWMSVSDLNFVIDEVGPLSYVPIPGLTCSTFKEHDSHRGVDGGKKVCRMVYSQF